MCLYTGVYDSTGQSIQIVKLEEENHTQRDRETERHTERERERESERETFPAVRIALRLCPIFSVGS